MGAFLIFGRVLDYGPTKYPMKKLLLFAWLLVCLHIETSAQLIEFGKPAVSAENTYLIGIDSLLNDQSSYILSSKWKCQRISEVDGQELTDTTRLFVAIAFVDDQVSALLAFKGSGFWSKQSFDAQNRLVWKTQFIDEARAILFVDSENMHRALGATHVLGIKALLDWASYRNEDTWALDVFAKPAEIIPKSTKAYVRSSDLKKPALFRKAEDREKMGVERIALFDTTLYSGPFKLPNSKDYYIEQTKVELEGKLFCSTKIYKINGGLQFAILEEVVDREVLGLTIPYVKYLHEDRALSDSEVSTLKKGARSKDESSRPNARLRTIIERY